MVNGSTRPHSPGTKDMGCAVLGGFTADLLGIGLVLLRGK